MSPRKEKIRPVFEAQVEKLDAEGRGVARRDGKVVFIQGALPGETVTYEQIRNKPSYEIGIVKEILTASELRVEPACPNFGIGPGTCGGCVMQHLDARAQVDFKQTVLTDALWHIGKVTPESILPPIVGEFGAIVTALVSRCATSPKRAGFWWAFTKRAQATSPT